MTVVEDQSARMPASGWLDRTLWIVGALLLVTVVGFGLFYYRDRYVHPNEPLAVREMQHLEEMVRQNPGDPGLRVAVAQWYLENDLVEQAIEQGQAAVKLDANRLDAWIVLGQSHLARGDSEAARTHFEKVVELNQDNPFAVMDSRMNLVYYNLGELYWQAGDYSHATESLKAALTIDRTDADARYMLATVYQEQGDHQSAIREFNESLRFVPDFAEAYQGLRASYEALNMRAEATYADAMVAYSQGDYELAAKRLEAVAESAPDLDVVYLGLGMIYEKLGQKEQAIAALQRYLESRPDSFAAQHLLGRVGARDEGQ